MNYGWPKAPLKCFTLKSRLFGVTNIVKISDKDRQLFSSYRITFDEGDWWSFGNDTARNFIIFGVDNSSSLYVDYRKNKFLMSGLGPTFGINGSLENIQH